VSDLVATRAVHRLKGILQDYDTLRQWDRSEIPATVTSAEPLTETQIEKLKAALQQQIGEGEKLILTQEIDPELLGGLKVQLGDNSIDLSVATRIQEIDNQLRASR